MTLEPRVRNVPPVRTRDSSRPPFKLQTLKAKLQDLDPRSNIAASWLHNPVPILDVRRSLDDVRGKTVLPQAGLAPSVRVSLTTTAAAIWRAASCLNRPSACSLTRAHARTSIIDRIRRSVSPPVPLARDLMPCTLLCVTASANTYTHCPSAPSF